MTGDNTWESVLYDFFKLQASIDALENGANKIQDEILSLLRISFEKSHISRTGYSHLYQLQLCQSRLEELFSVLNRPMVEYLRNLLQSILAIFSHVVAIVLGYTLLYVRHVDKNNA